MVWSIPVAIAAFIAAALVTVFGGVRLSKAGDILADRTGAGEALFGAVFFGGVISASGLVMSGVAAFHDRPHMAYSNAVGGIAAQTAALVVVDFWYRRANLEHAAASLPNIMYSVVLICMLVLAVALGEAPQWTLWSIHPGSLLLILAYVVGYRTVASVRHEPQWFPAQTLETVEDEPDEEDSERSTRSFWVEFLIVGLVVAGSGWVIATAAGSFVDHGGLDESFVGAAIMGIVNALPELITAAAAMRRGALTLAIAGVLGGNTFDVLNLVVSDVAYRGGSIYGAAKADDTLLTLTATLMVTVVLGGLLGRQKRGPAKIGFEGALVLALYVGILVVLSLPDATMG